MYQHVLFPTDGSALSQAAVQQAAKLAGLLGARITVLYVQPEYSKSVAGEAFMAGPFNEDFVRGNAAIANEIFAQATAQIEQAGVKCHCLMATSEEPWQVIIGTAKSNNCDLIFMASHGRSGLAGLLIGSQTQKVLTHCKIPVLVCR